MSDILATIGNYDITDADIDALIMALPKEQQMYKTIPAFREQVKGKLVEACLFAMLGEETGAKDTAEYAISIKAAQRDILGQIALNQMLDTIVVTDEEALAYFEANIDKFAKGPEAGAKHILVEAEDKALDIKSQIEAGTVSFEDAAKTYSSCPSSQKGGDLGKFGRGQMVAEFDEAVFTGEIEKVLGPVQTQFGYHLIYVYERTESDAPAFEDVKEMAKQRALQEKQMQAYDEKMAELKAKYMK